MQKRLLADASADSNDVQIQIDIQVIDLYCKTICKLPQTCQNFLITFICQTEYLPVCFATVFASPSAPLLIPQ